MRNRVNLGLLAGFLVGLSAPFLMASRNGAGTYSLPSGNPVVSGTTISTTWANNTLSDLSTEMTNSLDRTGRGGMSGVLKIAAGTVSAPGVAFAAETNTGLYRAGSNDVRLSVNGSDVQQWTGSVNAVTRAATFTPSSAGVAITASGNGANAGGVFTGGATDGAGLTATGGATNGAGLVGAGTGTGSGVVGSGASGSSGRGGSFTGGSSAGIGVVAAGGTGGIGIVTGGDGAGVGIQATGGATAAGVKAAAGTAASGGTRQDALIVTNGDIKLDGVTAPTSTTAVKNRLTVSSLVKAYATINSLSGTGSQTVSGGFNITSAAGSGGAPTVVTFTFAQAMADTNYTVMASTGDLCMVTIGTRTTTTVKVAFSDPLATGTCTGAAGAWDTYPLSILVIGLQ